jgi:[ribosomal protein S18]-alanine N-acetyltransferase
MSLFSPFPIRSLLPQDSIAISTLEQAIQMDPWSSRDLRESFEQGALGWGIETLSQNNIPELMAYLILKPTVDTADILTLGVHHAYRRQGLAQQLIAHTQHWAPQHHMDSLFLEVRVSNNAATHLYERCGFEKIHRRANYYSIPNQSGAREDAWLMKWQQPDNTRGLLV